MDLFLWTILHQDASKEIKNRLLNPLYCIFQAIEVDFNCSLILAKQQQDMTPSDSLSRIKVDKSNPHEISSISFELQDVLWEKILYSHQVWSREAKMTLGRVNGYDKPYLFHLKLEKGS